MHGRYFSMFSGIGGFELGLHNAVRAQEQRQQDDTQSNAQGGQGLESATRKRAGTQRRRLSAGAANGAYQRPLCVGFSEVDRYAIDIYRRHFPEHRNFGDCSKIDTRALPDFDLLVGGFPCQAFSIAGKRGGFSDTRGTLFFEIARLAGAKQPRLLLLENVKGLLSHGQGRTFYTIISTLDELGYDCEWQVLNSKDFGVPQNRERVFIVGHLRGQPRAQIFPLAGNGGEDHELPRHVANTLTRRYEGAQATGTYIAEGQLDAQVGTLRTHQSGRGFREAQSGLVPTIPARAREDGSGQPIVRVREATKKGYAEVTSGQAVQIRRLTPLECERLQGFPDGWTAGVSDCQRYKCLGNAVTVNVIAAIATALLRNLD